MAKSEHLLQRESDYQTTKFRNNSIIGLYSVQYLKSGQVPGFQMTFKNQIRTLTVRGYINPHHEKLIEVYRGIQTTDIRLMELFVRYSGHRVFD